MRNIGTVATEAQGRRLRDYLLTQGIKSQLEPTSDGWAVWVCDEDRVADGRAELASFKEDPEASRYAAAAVTAERLRSAAASQERERQRNVVDVRSQWTRPRANRPVTFALIAISVIVGFLSKFGADDRGQLIQRLVIARWRGAEVLAHDSRISRLLAPNSDIRRGEIWRLVTPIFIHFGPMHLLFNMLAAHSLLGVVEMRYGSMRLALLVVLLAVISNVSQYLWSGPTFGGMSGVVFGVFGFAWMKSRFDPTSGIYIDPGSVTMMLFFLVLCMTGYLGPIANTAHLTGLLAGVALALAPIFWRRLTHPPSPW
ncbi:MAG: rhomboid family intramembrane serine protease [Planctomycetaceae bacterium]